MDKSEVKIDLLSPEVDNWWHQVKLEGSNWYCTPGVQSFFNIFITHLDDGAECALSMFTDDTELGGLAVMPASHAATQRDLNRMKKCLSFCCVNFQPDQLPDWSVCLATAALWLL